MTDPKPPAPSIVDRLIDVIECEGRDCGYIGILGHVHFVELGAELAALRRERDAYKMLSEGLDKLCAAYRTGKPPSEATFNKIHKARAALEPQ